MATRNSSYAEVSLSEISLVDRLSFPDFASMREAYRAYRADAFDPSLAARVAALLAPSPPGAPPPPWAVSRPSHPRWPVILCGLIAFATGGAAVLRSPLVTDRAKGVNAAVAIAAPATGAACDTRPAGRAGSP